MDVLYTQSFLEDYDDLPAEIQRRVDRAVDKLSKNLQYPSLKVKRMQGRKKEQEDVWEARVSDSYRMTFNIDSSGITLRRVGPHDILKTP